MNGSRLAVANFGAHFEFNATYGPVILGVRRTERILGMRFKLRTIFVAVLFVAMICGFAVFIEHTWFGPARMGRVAQTEFDKLFAKRKWQGYAGAWHYDYRVRITSPAVGDNEIEERYLILHEIVWLKHIELHGTSLTNNGIAKMKREFPKCHFTIED